MTLASPAQATILLPGGVVASLPVTVSGSVVAVAGGGTGIQSWSFASAKPNKGTFREVVVKEASGTLDFLYQVHVNSGLSGGHVSVNAAADFTGWKTDVGFITSGFGFTTSTLPNAVTIDRTALGDTVHFNFTPPSAANILSGETSVIMVIKTNATTFTAGTAQLEDSALFSGVLSLQPVAVAEPVSIVLMATGVIGLGGYVWRRRKLQAV